MKANKTNSLYYIIKETVEIEVLDNQESIKSELIKLKLNQVTLIVKFLSTPTGPQRRHGKILSRKKLAICFFLCHR